ncbi:mitochondrial uncoupling protein 3-like [Hibiscus syriacus]|uniref:Mitochondrial uncoupling protein 3-like n=1 Tax=Hibiscus syriacus TaxID=106335 RepID=A0A6A3CC17_HIBSY|nr:uncharacterized protein LOC120201271 [Hibiscus syriacus]KAE8726306.1 mitochondrial uncoupling protein 3-like [Hibiscus syriacus]
MEAVSAASKSAAMKAINFPSTPTVPIIAFSTTSASPWSQVKLNMLTRHAPNPNTRFGSLCLSRCSTKPNIETDQNSTFEPNPNLNTENPSKVVSDEAISSSSSSTPSSSLSRGLVLDLDPVGCWDCKEIGSPVVKRFISDEEERWYMWYHGVSTQGSDSIGLAVSSNGVHWERGKGGVKSSADVGLVMSCGNDWWAFDTQSIRPGEVVIMSSAKVRASSAVYWLYYTGYSAEKVDISGFNLQNPETLSVESGNILRSLPGLAISQDGRHWARIEGEHHSGALFDVGSEGDWDSLFISSPQVVFHGNGDLRMYYHSFDVENRAFSIGIARSRDGMKWIKLGKILGGGKKGCFDELGAMNSYVVKNKRDGNYVMAYEGVGADGGRAIGLAVSADGLKDWRRVEDEAVLKGAIMEDGWDSKGVGSPCLVEMDGDVDEWRLYFRGVGNGGRCGIGMAVSDGSDITRFRRWKGFQV